MSNPKLEAEFAALLADVGATIKSNLQIADRALVDASAHPAAALALKTATELADKHGVPFCSNVIAVSKNLVMRMDNTYVPPSFFDKYQGLDPAKVAELTKVAEYALTPPKEEWEESREEQWDESWEESDDD